MFCRSQSSVAVCNNPSSPSSPTSSAGNCALVHGEIGADGEEGSSQTATDNMTSATDVSATDVSDSDDDTPARPKQR